PVWPWVLAVLLLAAAGVAAWFAYTKIQDQLNNTKPVPVPNVIDLRVELAKTKLTEHGFVPKVKPSTSETVPKGVVFDQNPLAGSKLAKNSPAQIAGFGVKRTNVDSNQPADTVVSESPTSAAPGSTITLSVSKGPKQSTVPDVTSEDEASAKSDLQSAGFKVVVQRQTVTDPGLDGIVLSQIPHGGMKAVQASPR